MKFTVKPSPIFNAAKKIVQAIRQHGGEAFFVGGFVRNTLMHLPCKDIDIVSDLTPAQLLEIFPDAEQTGVSFGVIIAKCDSFAFEIATAREERFYMDGRHPQEVRYTKNFKTDSERRDFTVNAMLFDPVKMEITDFHGGIEDLQKGILRTVGDADTRFNEDYLRMLRAIRFAAKYNFVIEENTFNAIIRNANLCANLAAERIRQELDWMFENKNAVNAFKLLDKTNILQVVLPEVHALHGVEQPKIFHPEGDVFKHTVKMLSHMAYPSKDLAWSIILHDVGKKACFFRDEKGIHFFGHESKGAEIAEQILIRLRFSNTRQERIASAVRDHMRFVQIKQMKKSTLRKLLGRKDFALLAELNRLDSIASSFCINDWLAVMDALDRLGNEDILPEPLVKGKDLIALGIKPGPYFKKLLDYAYEMQLSDKKIDFHAACDLIKKKIPCILKNGSLHK